MKTDYIRAWLINNLSEKRLKHTFAVVEVAKKLAKQYNCDIEKAEIAALCHDTYRCISIKENNRLIKEYGLSDKYINNPNLAHSKIAALKIVDQFNIKDKDIINAVSFHTTGRENMSLLEKIIYISDAIEPGRDYLNVDKIRKIAYKNLNMACIMSMKNTISYVVNEGQTVDEETVMALKSLEEREKNE